MGQYSTDVKMDFGTTLEFKKEWTTGDITLEIGDQVRVANYVRKYYVELHHPYIRNLIKMKVELIDEYLQVVEDV